MVSDITLFPQPQSLERAEGYFTLNGDTRVLTGDSKVGEMLATYLRPATGFLIPVAPANETGESGNSIQLIADDRLPSPEAYNLDVSRGGRFDNRRRTRRIRAWLPNPATVAASEDT